MQAYDNPPGSSVTVIALFSKNEYAYLTENGYKEAVKSASETKEPSALLRIGFFRTFGEVGAGHCVCSNWRSFRLHARRVCAADRISRVRTWSV
jgi:hypothetical protein